MSRSKPLSPEDSWRREDREWREPGQIISHWRDADSVDPALLRWRARGAWWEVLAQEGVTLLVTREYEHLVMCLGARDSTPSVSFMPLPHPSGIAIDRERRTVHLSSTRNPNLIFDLRPVRGLMDRQDVRADPPAERLLVPVRSRCYAGCLYIHDLALVGGVLHANAVGQNAVVRLPDDGSHEAVWWPRCIDSKEGPLFGRNHLQLNSIAAGADMDRSFFSASTDLPSARRPGHANFPVDGRGVIFSGATREPIARGLTRPHSARLLDRTLWVDNSGYGEVGVVEDGRFRPVARLPGWTRGLCFQGSVAFVGTSRVLPRFAQYAPGLDPDAATCGVHAIDVANGRLLGSLIWPLGNQIFAVEPLPPDLAIGLPFRAGRRARAREQRLFYSFTTELP